MCGIAGYAIDGVPASSGILQKMGEAMISRGPDDEGLVLDGEVGLIHRRLSIIDLANGKNPIYNEDNTVCALLNGEIYNYRELRADLQSKGHVFRTQSDTEVLVHLYEQYGNGFVGHLNGMFGFVIYDNKSKKILIGRDRVGQKPLYFVNKGGTFSFASDLRCFSALPALDLTIDNLAVLSFLRYQYVPAPLSIYNEVQKVSPGTCIEYQQGKLKESTYWKFPVPMCDHSVRTQSVVQEEFESLLHDSVRMRMVADVPVGSFLSGGLDSSIVTSLMCQSSNNPISTFSIGFTDASYDESSNARMVADQLGTKHKESILSSIPVDAVDRILLEFGEPYADASALPTYYLCQLAADHVKVALSGDGADELLGGYNRYRVGRLMNIYGSIPQWIRPASLSRLVSFLPDSKKYYATNLNSKIKHVARVMDAFGSIPGAASSHMFTPMELEQASDVSDILGDQDPVLLRDRGVSHLGWPENMLFADCLNYLPDDILVKVDRMSMAHSLEVRSPFMDYRLIEYVSGLPMNYKLSNGESKRILRAMGNKQFPKVAAQTKHGFEAPIGQWLAKDFRDKLVELIDRQSIPIINHTYFRDLAVEHGRNNRDYSKKLWPLYVLLNWANSQSS